MSKWLALALILLPTVALGVPGRPLPLGNSDEYSRAGQCANGHSFPVFTYTKAVRTSTGGTTGDHDRPLLIPFGSLVNLACDAAATFCWVQEDAIVTSTSGYVTDASSTGPRTEGVGGCFEVLGSSYRDQAAWRSLASSDMVSQRTNACSSTDTAIDAAISGYPCDATADCFYDEGVSCDQTTAIKGNMLIAIAAAATDCWICVEQ